MHVIYFFVNSVANYLQKANRKVNDNPLLEVENMLLGVRLIFVIQASFVRHQNQKYYDKNVADGSLLVSLFLEQRIISTIRPSAPAAGRQIVK